MWEFLYSEVWWVASLGTAMFSLMGAVVGTWVAVASKEQGTPKKEPMKLDKRYPLMCIKIDHTRNGLNQELDLLKSGLGKDIAITKRELSQEIAITKSELSQEVAIAKNELGKDIAKIVETVMMINITTETQKEIQKMAHDDMSDMQKLIMKSVNGPTWIDEKTKRLSTEIADLKATNTKLFDRILRMQESHQKETGEIKHAAQSKIREMDITNANKIRVLESISALEKEHNNELWNLLNDCYSRAVVKGKLKTGENASTVQEKIVSTETRTML